MNAMLVPVVLLAVVAQLAVAFDGPVELQTHWFVTQLDNFRPQEERTINMTYHANVQHYQPGGPIYIYIKDVYDRSTQWIEGGLMVDIARNTSGALYTYDARYLGENIPNIAADLDGLQFLTPEQSLEDLATFVATLHQRSEDNAQVILWGSGYGATLATWARKKYPHLIDAAWSSSGLYDMEVATLSVFDSLSYTIHRAVGFECRNRLQEAMNELDALVRAGEADQIVRQLGLCSVGDLTDDQEVGLLFETLLHYVIDNVEKRHTQGVKTFCDALELPAGRPLQALGRWLNYEYGNDECRDVSYERMVARASSVEWSEDSSAGLRQLAFLQCTQSGLFQITDAVTWLPDHQSVAYNQRKCEDILGAGYRFDHLLRANAALATRYGSQYQSVTRVLYTNGMIDPWFTHGIVYSRDPSTTVLNIEHFARSADLTSIRADDATALLQAKQAIFEQIVRWSLNV